MQRFIKLFIVFVFTCCTIVEGQTLTGRVTSADEAIVGATVVWGKEATLTDSTGHFVISIPSNSEKMLQVSATGLWDPLESTCRHASLSIL